MVAIPGSLLILRVAPTIQLLGVREEAVESVLEGQPLLAGQDGEKGVDGAGVEIAPPAPERTVLVSEDDAAYPTIPGVRLTPARTRDARRRAGHLHHVLVTRYHRIRYFRDRRGGGEVALDDAEKEELPGGDPRIPQSCVREYLPSTARGARPGA
jgi:hypothetical protein